MNKKIKVTDDILDQQLDILPKEIKFCKTCIVSNQRPRILWDQMKKGQNQYLCSRIKQNLKKDLYISLQHFGILLFLVCNSLLFYQLKKLKKQ